MQDGEELVLLEQLFKAIGVDPELNQRSYHLQQLRRLTFFAIEYEPTMKRLKGSSMCLTLQRLADVQQVEHRKKQLTNSDPDVLLVDTGSFPPMGRRRKNLQNLMAPGYTRGTAEEQERHTLVC